VRAGNASRAGGIVRGMTTREIVTAYLRAIEAHELDEVAGYLHPDVVNVEHPNKLSPTGRRYDLAEIRAAGERGAAVMASERYEVRQMIVEGNRAAVQIDWSGTLAIAAGALPAGHVMRAQICSIIELRDGKVWRQEQYDCFG
jgi:ketosteroid isomerase-like protein